MKIALKLRDPNTTVSGVPRQVHELLAVIDIGDAVESATLSDGCSSDELRRLLNGNSLYLGPYIETKPETPAGSKDDKPGEKRKPDKGKD